MISFNLQKQDPDVLSSVLTDKTSVYLDMNFLTLKQAELIFDKVISLTSIIKFYITNQRSFRLEEKVVVWKISKYPTMP